MRRWSVVLVAAAAVAALLLGMVGWVGTLSGSPADSAAPAGRGPATAAKPVPVTGYAERPDNRLRVHYTIGVPSCYGRLDAPQVHETAEAVHVTLTRREPVHAGERACIELALMRVVTVELAAPLGGRVVRDGTDARVVQPAGAAHGPAPR